MRAIIGDEVGLLKVLEYEKDTSKPVQLKQSWGKVDRAQEIHLMALDPLENHVLVGRKTGIVECYNTDSGMKQWNSESFFASTNNNNSNLEDRFVGLESLETNNSLLIGRRSGIVEFRGFDSEKGLSQEPLVQINCGKDLFRAKVCPSSSNLFACGGKESDLAIWDINATDLTKPSIKAKNVSHDRVELRVPIWVTDLQFVTPSTVVVGTGHHHLRYYDFRHGRKPVLSIDVGQKPVKCLSLTNDLNSVVIANTLGTITRYDFRKGTILNGYKGCAGSINSLACHPSLPLVASVGLDRHFRVHHIETGKLIQKLYVRQHLNSVVLFKNESSPELDNDAVVGSSTKGKSSKDELWDSLPSVEDETMNVTNKKKKKASENADDTSTNKASNTKRLKSMKSK